MQIAGTEKMGFYPTPSQTLDLLRRVVAVATGANLRILDPCAGEGQALGALAEALRAQGAHVTTYGVELSPQRAARAKTGWTT